MGHYRHEIESSAEFTIGWALEFAESDFRDDFVEVWGLEAAAPPAGMDRDDWIACRRVYGEANQIAEVAMLLVRKKGLGPQRLAAGSQLAEEARSADQRLAELLAAMEPHLAPADFARVREQLDRPSADDPRSRRAIFANTIQLAVRRIFPPTLDEVGLRVESLVRYVVASQNERTNAFLSRVATCYLLGLKTELAVMARAVLGAALEEIAPDEAVRDALNSRKDARVGLSARFTYLDRFYSVGRDAREAMDRLKKAGDDAVHTTPGLEPDPDAIMGDLLAALTGLDSLRTRG